MGEDSKYCSNCKKSVSGTNFTVHTVHCHKNIVSCSICHEPVSKSQYQNHVEAAHSSIPCESCGIKVEAANLFYHQKELCPKRLLACKYCELEVNAIELEKHLEYCGARTDRCKGCTKYVQSKHLQFHYEHDHRYLCPEEKDIADANGQGGDEGEECPVCLGPITLPLTLQCGHVFCMVCVKGIASTTKNCAICRRDIHRDMLMDIRFCGEADIIKNYVNNPKYKKTTRSKSVPRVGVTTQDYDDMVSQLLSSRTSTTNCRYQRPNNGHTPPSYTPYCYAPSHSTFTAPRYSTSYSKDDDYYCASSASQSSTTCRSAPPRPNSPPSLHSSLSTFISAYSPSTTTTITTSSSLATSPVASRRSVSANPSTSLAAHQRRFREEEDDDDSTSSRPVNPVVISSIPPSGSRPRRPTSLALQSRDNAQADDAEPNEHHHLSQEEYDRWLAFQVAKDDSAAEMAKNTRAPFRRSRSMPESKESPEASDSQAVTKGTSDTPDRKSETQTRNDAQSRLPPTSPRCNSSSGTSNSPPSNRRSNITKSSSDSNATEGSTSSNSNSALNTGARPKSSTGLKKRVSFKEDSPPLRRQAPVLLPCEFCEEMFSERDLMRHQTSCDQNETKNPREYLLARRTSGTSPLTSPTSPISPISPTLPTLPPLPSPNTNLASPSRLPPTPSPLNRNTESPARVSSHTRGLRTPPHSPSLHARPPPSPISPPRSPSTSSSPQFNTGSSESYDSAIDSRHTSISPCPVSVNSTSGVSSGISSISSSSASTTPSTSSSASPVPAVSQVDTQTEAEVDFEEEIPFARPRKGKLISSAIASWRSIAGSTTPLPRPRYTRSNTAPLNDFRDDKDSSAGGVSTSHSATVIQDQKDTNEDDTPQVQRPSEPKTSVFIRNRNKYRAPPPPTSAGRGSNDASKNIPSLSSDSGIAINSTAKCEPCPKRTNTESVSDSLSQHKKEGRNVISNIKSKKSSKSSDSGGGNVFKFDSRTMMSEPPQQDLNDVIPCEFCKEVFSPQKFRDHQAVCEADAENGFPASTTNHSSATADGDHQQSNIPSRGARGQEAQKPSAETQVNKKSSIERSNSVRESSTYAARRSREFETSGSRLERTSSIKETSRYSRTRGAESPPRRWMSREGVYSSNLDLSAAYSGGASLTSSTTSLNSYSGGKGWSSHLNMIRDEVRALRPSSLGGATSAFFGSSRYRDRSMNRHRPSSLYSSRTAFKLIADAFQGPKDKGRYLR